MRKAVLLVEDDEIIADVLIDVLTDEGYEVRRAGNGRHALNLLATWLPDAILLDLTTPEMDGWAFRAEQLRRPAPLARIPVIVLTGAYVAERETGELAAEEIIRKPFELDSLLDVVARACRRDAEPAVPARF